MATPTTPLAPKKEENVANKSNKHFLKNVTITYTFHVKKNCFTRTFV